MANILVADDEPAIVEMLKMILHEHTIHSVTCGAALYDLLCRKTYDLVISDIMLPDVLGPDAYELSGSRVPVIFISGCTPERFAKLEVLHKPFSIHELHAAVERALEWSS